MYLLPFKIYFPIPNLSNRLHMFLEPLGIFYFDLTKISTHYCTGHLALTKFPKM